MDVVVVLLMVLGAVFALILIGFALSRVVMGNHARRARSLLPPLAPGDYEESAVGLTVPFKAYGLLRANSSGLVFATGQTGEVVAIRRRSIVSAFASEDVPTGTGMQTLRRPALVLQLNDPTLPQGLGFMVSDPAAWVQRLRR